jgi:hypothetical protein
MKNLGLILIKDELGMAILLHINTDRTTVLLTLGDRFSIKKDQRAIAEGQRCSDMLVRRGERGNSLIIWSEMKR